MSIKKFFVNLKNKFNEYFKPRYYYVERYLNDLKFSSKDTKKVKKEIKDLQEKAHFELKGVKRLHIISILIYVAIYFSIVSYFLSDIYFIGEAVDLIRNVIAVVGTPIFVGLQFFVTRLRNIRFEKLSLYVSHLISYSVKE